MKSVVRKPLKENGREILNDWISENVAKIREDECADIIREQENNQIRKIIVQSIEKVLSNWKNN